ncbi:MAG: saccharopine dehydrogenase NADP-binding domain-containing protein [Deltaproteobacteria bacterium]|nr:saccharopine dehydrogenase NADP-binding domain-containing protein [Deltaproteobacteria bacterium]
MSGGMKGGAVKFAVIGGAGAMGRITVTDLVKTGEAGDEIVIADYDLEKAEALARELSGGRKSSAGPRVSAVRVDVKKRDEAARALAGAFALINCAQYQMNLEVMEIALAAGAHYVDLGGLFHITRKQLALDARFKHAGKIALLGMGAAPGITNILSRFGADRLDTVREIHARVGSMDKTRYESAPALPVAYSLKTILEEFSFEPAVFTKGEFTFVKPMSGDVPHRFPPPIGVRRPMYTIHSEVATLPLSFREKGVREVSFKIAFDPLFVDRVKFLRDFGMASHDAIEVPSARDGDAGMIRVRPIDVVNKVAMSQKPGRQAGKLKQYEVVRAVVKGMRKGEKATWIVDCHTAGMPEWGVGLDIDTGSPPAIAAQMLKYGEIRGAGALAPEIAVPPKPFFERLKKRGMNVRATRKSGWDFSV